MRIEEHIMYDQYVCVWEWIFSDDIFGHKELAMCEYLSDGVTIYINLKLQSSYSKGATVA